MNFPISMDFWRPISWVPATHARHSPWLLRLETANPISGDCVHTWLCQSPKLVHEPNKLPLLEYDEVGDDEDGVVNPPLVVVGTCRFLHILF